MEHILEEEHPLRLMYMRATGCSYEDAILAFERVKKEATHMLVNKVQLEASTKELAKRCTCEQSRFPEAERQGLRATPGNHHVLDCPHYSGFD